MGVARSGTPCKAKLQGCGFRKFRLEMESMMSLTFLGCRGQSLFLPWEEGVCEVGQCSKTGKGKS